MKVNCANCENFTPPIKENPNYFFSKIIVKEKCKIGKKLRFSIPKNTLEYGGWFRYCENYKEK